MMVRTDFKDEKCTCLKCGNTHEYYGGTGYTSIDHSNVIGNTGTICTEYVCNTCGKVHVYVDKND